MVYVNMTVYAHTTDNMYGKVSDEIWKQYKNGEISAWKLYEYMNAIVDDNLSYEVDEIDEDSIRGVN